MLWGRWPGFGRDLTVFAWRARGTLEGWGRKILVGDRTARATDEYSDISVSSGLLYPEKVGRGLGGNGDGVLSC